MTEARATYPVSLVLEGRTVLLVGGGRVALRKAEGLVAAGAALRVVAPEVDPALEALVGSSPGGVERRGFEPDDVTGCWLVVEATGRPIVAEAVAAACERHRVWLNAADQPDSCSVLLPAVVRRGPVTVAYSTTGSSPALASWMRARGEQTYGPEYGELAALLSDARAEWRSSGRSSEALDWRAVLDSGILEVVRQGRIAEAKESLRAWLSSSSD